MNTPEQIAEKWAKSLATGRLDNFGAIKSAIAEATQPLNQRLIAAEMQVGKMKDGLRDAVMFIEAGYIDWDKLNPYSPDHEPGYKPEFPEIVHRLNALRDQPPSPPHQRSFHGDADGVGGCTISPQTSKGGWSGMSESLHVGDAVEVLCPGLKMLRNLVPGMPPNHHGTVGEIWDDGTIVVHFPLPGDNHSQAAPYPPELVKRRTV